MTVHEIKSTILSAAEQAIDQRIAAGVPIGPRGEAVANVLMGMDMAATVLESGVFSAAEIRQGIKAFHADMDNIRNRDQN